MAKIKVCERVLNFTIPSGLSVMDSAHNISQINRMSFRQGMEYAYDGLEIFSLDPESTGLVQVYRLPQTWVSANAWYKAFRVWKDQRDDAMRESGLSYSTEGKYSDFKIYYNLGHQSGTQAGEIVQVINPNSFITRAQAQVIDAGAEMEWAYSTFVVPNVGGTGGTTEEYYGGLIGSDSGTYKSLILAYAESRARPFPLDPSNLEPASASHVPGGLFAEMQDVGEDLHEVISGVREQNDSPPYVVGGVDSAEEFYPWGENQGNVKGNMLDYLIVRSGSTIATDSTGPFTAFCGLLFFDNTTGTSLQARLKFSAGEYKGVMARPMQDVN